MSRATKENLKELAKYPKNEIIEALGNQYGSDFIVANMIVELSSKETQKALDEHEEALRAETEAREAYINWLNEMCVKYGDGKKVNVFSLPRAEISHGAKLETALKKATETERRLDAKVSKLLKLKE